MARCDDYPETQLRKDPSTTSEYAGRYAAVNGQRVKILSEACDKKAKVKFLLVELMDGGKCSHVKGYVKDAYVKRAV